ncbi:MAG: SCO family protein [Bacteroidales bacterium]|nr:SCO family protein [Bacteroidales bacterium]
MKKSILTITLCAILLVSCNKNPEVKTKSCCSSEKPASALKELSGESVYNLASAWTSSKNEQLELSHFRDKIVIAAMVFTHCESACPRIVADMQRIESSLSEKELEQVSFLLISMDPERDTPARLTEFAAAHKLNSNWTLICSSPDATMEIANVLGVKVKKLESGGFDHSNIIHVFDREGVVVKQQNGFAVEQEATIKAIRTLIK